MALCPGLPGWAGTRKVKPIWILLKQETVSGSGISWTICKSACRSRQITMPAPHRSVFYRPDALPVTQPTVSKHWRQTDNSLGQFVHTCVPLSPSSIIWRWCLAVEKVTKVWHCTGYASQTSATGSCPKNGDEHPAYTPYRIWHSFTCFKAAAYH